MSGFNGGYATGMRSATPGLTGLQYGALGANSGQPPSIGGMAPGMGQSPHAAQAPWLPPGQMQEYGSAAQPMQPQQPQSQPPDMGMDRNAFNNRNAGIGGGMQGSQPGMMPPTAAPGMSSYGALGQNAQQQPSSMSQGGLPPSSNFTPGQTQGQLPGSMGQLPPGMAGQGGGLNAMAMNSQAGQQQAQQQQQSAGTGGFGMNSMGMSPTAGFGSGQPGQGGYNPTQQPGSQSANGNYVGAGGPTSSWQNPASGGQPLWQQWGWNSPSSGGGGPNSMGQSPQTPQQMGGPQNSMQGTAGGYQGGPGQNNQSLGMQQNALNQPMQSMFQR